MISSEQLLETIHVLNEGIDEMDEQIVSQYQFAIKQTKNFLMIWLDKRRKEEKSILPVVNEATKIFEKAVEADERDLRIVKRIMGNG